MHGCVISGLHAEKQTVHSLQGLSENTSFCFDFELNSNNCFIDVHNTCDITGLC